MIILSRALDVESIRCFANVIIQRFYTTAGKGGLDNESKAKLFFSVKVIAFAQTEM